MLIEKCICQIVGANQEEGAADDDFDLDLLDFSKSKKKKKKKTNLDELIAEADEKSEDKENGMLLNFTVDILNII